MKRLRLSLGTLIAVTLSLLAAVQPDPALAIDCFCGSFRNTPTIWTHSFNSCAHAESKLWNQSSEQMDCGLSNTCSPFLVIDTSCFYEPAIAAYRIRGHINYGCYIGSECP